MNKYQEAIMLVREMLNTAEPNVMNHLAANRKLDHELQELVDKATPKTPIFEHSGQRSPDGVSTIVFAKYTCPCCGNRITEIDRFCPNCGQAIGVFWK